jgi:hypothetical protein
MKDFLGLTTYFALKLIISDHFSNAEEDPGIVSERFSCLPLCSTMGIKAQMLMPLSHVPDPSLTDFPLSRMSDGGGEE